MGICRLWRSRRPGDAVAYLLAVAVAFVALTNAAKAQSQQAQDQTMAIFQAIQAGAAVAGVPVLPPEAVPIVSGILSCASSGTPVGTCATNVAISTALSQLGTSNALGDNTALVTAAASCLVSGQPAGSCVASLAASQLPDEAKPLITCIGAGGNIGDCAEKAALTVAQQQLGTKLPPEAQQMVSCVVGGQSTITSCVSSLAQNTVDQALKATNAPPEVVSAVDGMVSCIAAGNKAGDCVKNVALANIPPGPAKDFATCLNQPNASAQGCAATLASNNVSDPTAKALVGCMGNTSGDAAQKCIATNASSALGNLAQQQAQQALSTAIQTATTAIQNLQIDAPLQTPPKFPAEPAVLANLLQVAKGIQDGNWLEVVAGVGPEAAEVASKIILSYFLTPALSGLLAPVVDSMIQNDVNAFTNGVTALSKGDAVGLAEDIFKWYETQYIQAPCALMPSGDVSNAICNGLAASINWVANAGGNIAKDILGVGEDVLKDLGIWNFVDGAATTVWNDFTSIISDIGHFLGLGGGDERPDVVCVNFPTPASYFATNVLSACLNAAASNAASPSPVSTTANVTAQCTGLYARCATSKAASDAVTKNCTSMANALNQAASTTAAALKNAASGYAQTAIAAFVAKTNSQYLKSDPTNTSVCESGFWGLPNPGGGTNAGNLAASCAKSLGGLFQLPANSCPTSTINPTYDALTQACLTAISNAPQASTNNSYSAAGPNSPLCKQVTAINPCSKQVTYAGTDVTIYLPDPACSLFRLPPSWTFLPLRPTPVSLPGPKFVPVPKLPPRPAGSTPKPPPATASTGGHGDAFYIDGCSGNSPSANCNGASGGSKGSAMDNAAAAATGGGLTGVAGTGGGGAAIAPRLHPIGGMPYVPPKFVPPTAKQPPTSVGVKPPPPKPATATSKSPPVSPNAIDYGACTTCGKVAPPEIIK